MTSRIVIVTREEDPREGRLGAALRAVGLEPRHVPLIVSRRRQPDDPALDSALAALAHDDWVVFTSRRAAAFWFEAMGERGLHPGQARPAGRVAAVGQATAEAVHAGGWQTDLVPEQATGGALAGALFEAMGGDAHGRVIVFPRGADVAGDWPRRLEAAGARLIAPVLYETAAVEADLGPLLNDAAAGHIGAITFASPSAAESFAGNLKRCGRPWPGGCLMAAIGPTTAAALRRLGLEPVWESPAAAFADFSCALTEELLRKK